MKYIFSFVLLTVLGVNSLIGQESRFKQHVISTTADYASYAEVIDMNGDEHLDVLFCAQDGDKIAWCENDGAGNFNEHVISLTAKGVRYVQAEDVDKDGDMDILSACKDDSKIIWYENNGSYRFQEHVISTTAMGARAVCVADVDGDKDWDILSASWDDDKIAWYENDGSNNFEEHIISDMVDGASSLKTADIDNDGDIDVLTTSYKGDEIIWYKNDGSGSFQKHTVLSELDGAVYADIGDIDNDGDLDLLSAATYDGKVTWHENDGSGNFQSHLISNARNWVRSVKIADIDNDGHLDALSASRKDNKLVWYKNDGSGNFEARVIASYAQGTVLVNAGDLDGDGDSDVVSAFYMEDKIVWYENLSILNNVEITNATTDEDTQTMTGLVVSREVTDGLDVTYIQVTNIENGTLYKNDGVTEIINNSFVSYEEATKGLRFTPKENYSGMATFDIQASLNNNETGLGNEKVTAEIIVNPVNDAPELISEFEDITRLYGDGKIQETDITAFFADSDGDIANLSYTVSSTSEQVVTVTETSGKLTLNYLHAGEATITITATDNKSASFSTDFKVLIEPAVLTITPNDARREVGFVNADFVGNYSGLQYDDAIANIEYYTEATVSSSEGIASILVGDIMMQKGSIDDYTVVRNTGSLEIYSTNNIFIPNLFTPNQDGNNDTFFIVCTDISSIELKLFDKLGNVVFQSSSIEEIRSTGWDGKLNGNKMPEGNYIWQIAGKFTDGKAVSFRGKNTGVVTLVR